LAALQDILNASQRAFNNASEGRVMAVLFDRAGRKPGQLVGRSPYMQPVHAMAPDSLMGCITDVAITETHANSLGGELVGETKGAEGQSGARETQRRISA